MDNDGNIVLDLNCGLPLGYPRTDMLTEFYEKFIKGSTTIEADWDDLIRENLLPVAPNGTNVVTLTEGTATIANESAIQSAFKSYAAQHGRSSE